MFKYSALASLNLELFLPEGEWAIHLTSDYNSHCIQQKLSLITRLRGDPWVKTRPWADTVQVSAP